MKSLYKILSIGAMSALAVSCADDLNTEFLGNQVTTEQKEEVLGLDPAKALASVTGSFATMNRYGAIFDFHGDFGYPAIMLGLDMQTEDCLSLNNGYNHFNYWARYSSPNNNGTPAAMMWYHMYKVIFNANALIASIPGDTQEAELQFYLANGLALRAFCYFNLVQTFQFNYIIDPQALGLPIITDENTEECAANGCPRSTLVDTYAQIEKDLDTAISLLEATKVTAQDVIDTKVHRLFTKASVYGMRARVHLVKHEYAKAAEFADKAIANFNGRPYTYDEVSKPTFASLDDPSWMWGLAVAETDRTVTTGICNWPSFMVTFSDGYVNTGSWKYCGYKLYSYIPPTDVRKGWFLDDDFTSPNISSAQQNYINIYVDPNLTPASFMEQASTSFSSMLPQTNVKFDSYNGVIEQSVNANDIPFMRVEEMYYIKAEGQAMSGNTAGGLQTLTDFVKTYRDPSYAFSGSSAEQIQEEIWMQRRAEFWGEGVAYYDLMRLNKGVDRRGDRCQVTYRYNIPAQDPVLIYCIPESEITANPQISYAEGNENATMPKTVPDEE